MLFIVIALLRDTRVFCYVRSIHLGDRLSLCMQSNMLLFTTGSSARAYSNNITSKLLLLSYGIVSKVMTIRYKMMHK